MSANRDFERTDDEILALLSQWSVGTLGNDALLKRLEEIETDDLPPGARSALRDLVAGLEKAFPGERAGVEALVRETVEAFAYGD